MRLTHIMFKMMSDKHQNEHTVHYIFCFPPRIYYTCTFRANDSVFINTYLYRSHYVNSGTIEMYYNIDVNAYRLLIYIYYRVANCDIPDIYIYIFITLI